MSGLGYLASGSIVSVQDMVEGIVVTQDRAFLYA